MNTETPKISLTINLEGSHKPRFVWDPEKYDHRTGKKGKMVRYYGKVFTSKKGEFLGFKPGYPSTTKAVHHRVLPEEFVKNAVKFPADGYGKKKWKSLPAKERVNKHVRQLVKDMFDLSYIDHTVYQWDFIPEQETV